MKYITTTLLSIIAVSTATVIVLEQSSDQVVVDRGYECFNLEIAQAQLDYVQEYGNWGQIWSARRAVKNWEKLCK